MLDLVLPPVCVDCGAGLDMDPVGRLLCGNCLGGLCRDVHLPTCPGCGLPRDPRLPKTARCWECQRRKFRFDQVVALGVYRGPLRQAAIRMKQFHEAALVAAVGDLLAERLDEVLGSDLPQWIVPIPKFWVKRIVRGANTAEVLAESVSRRWGRPAIVHALRCRKSTRKQSLLGWRERQRNLAGALQLVRRHGFNKAHVLIVDDIMTTGATANEAARVLRRAGAGRITVAVVARATRGRELPFLGNDTLAAAEAMPLDRDGDVPGRFPEE
jgi:ComF family protein